ncbi:ATP-grasp domain-containing protein [Nitrosomonas aestuarii]|uniref:ATP-grasp domain-containing protein n=1 Tax=Nitrosomonas aestuarii TaxID=52441 RepID=A0A1I4EPA2_9PROT|nr:ATP-grasp domain-containing protein [Nitrosomonas aestuarii]SFL05991.1 ATP-grasp domain-containing protein [Nitrosomonas aestuarii]
MKMKSAQNNIFVFGADQFNLTQMQALDSAANYRFHELFSFRQVKSGREFPVKALYEGALEQLKRFPGSIDAIVGYWDFPVSIMLPLLRKPYGLASPSYEAVLKCEHKYWCRLEQKKIVPEYIPDFCAVNPFADEPGQSITVAYPFWIKPVKAASSHLGFKVRNDAELKQAIQTIRRNIFRFANPFNYMLQFVRLPDEVANVDGNYCIVESIISRGRQCTLEGYVYQGEVTVYGVVDSIREGQHRCSFARYQYPSTIPQRIQQEMTAVTRHFLEYIDFDNGPFNIEYYWEHHQHAEDKIWLLEINTRISKSHCPLFRDVDGATHQKVMLELALGQKPDFPYRQGSYKVAAKFMWRIYKDAFVRHVPTANDLSVLKRQFPEADIQLHIHSGMYLSELKDQDSYSYEIAVIFLGGNTQKELLQKYRDVQQAMRIELEPVDGQISN